MPTDFQVIKAIKKALPAAVSIVGNKQIPRKKGESSQFWGLFEDKKTSLNISSQLKKDFKKISSGSGFIISSDGIIATNSHLISPLVEEYRVILNSGEEFSAKILATDFINDLVLLKIEEKGLPIIELGDSERLELGQTAIAIGTALGEFQNSVSVGVVSGLSRFISAKSMISGKVSKLRGLIQTDAAVNPGNSGGPLINLNGQAIGINTALVFGAENIGFAIPVHHLREDLREIKKYGKIREPYLGIRYLLLNSNLKKRNGLPVNYGALVISEDLPDDKAVMPNSPAEKAGIKEFDIILKCQNQEITEKMPLEEILKRLDNLKEVKFEILRKDKRLFLKATIEERG